MPWNPEQYNTFKEIRYKPFFDLLAMIEGKNLNDGVDIGCGTGEQTAILSEKFPHANLLGIDTSREMLAESTKFENEKLQFQFTSFEEFIDSPGQYDLVFSNAALQWSDDHQELFPKLIAKLKEGGQFAVQMPFQKENVLNQLLLGQVQEQPFVNWLQGYSRTSPLLQIDEYANMMFACGLKDLSISLKVYPIIARDEMELYNFIAGSALIPYMEKLNAEQQSLFNEVYRKRIKDHFPSFPTLYAFKRILLYGVMSAGNNIV